MKNGLFVSKGFLVNETMYHHYIYKKIIDVNGNEKVKISDLYQTKNTYTVKTPDQFKGPPCNRERSLNTPDLPSLLFVNDKLSHQLCVGVLFSRDFVGYETPCHRDVVSCRDNEKDSFKRSFTNQVSLKL